jgi:RNA 2',3'-cyclic 3'-phosphodiesterase
MRFFISLEIPENSREQLAEVQNKLIQIIPSLKPTDPDKLHLTIAFVGEQPDQLKEPLIEVLNKSVDGIHPFTVTPAYIDGFPNLHHAHVVWVGVKGDIDKLFMVRERIKDGLISLKMDADERRFIPHIALGKTSSFDLIPEQELEIEKLEQLQFNPIQVTSIKLFESVPDHGLHSHNTLAEIKLI